MLSPQEYEQQLEWVQAALPAIDPEHCRHVFYEVARRNICKAMHCLLEPETPLEALQQEWAALPRSATAQRRQCLEGMLQHHFPNARYHAALRQPNLPDIPPKVLDRLKGYKRAPRKALLEQWFSSIDPDETELLQFLLNELRYFRHALSPFWATVDGYARHHDGAVARAALELIVHIPSGVKRSMDTFRLLLGQPERQLHALQALQHARGLPDTTTKRLISPIVKAYKDLEREKGSPNNLSAEYALARNIASNNGISLTLTNINLNKY